FLSRTCGLSKDLPTGKRSPSGATPDRLRRDSPSSPDHRPASRRDIPGSLRVYVNADGALRPPQDPRCEVSESANLTDRAPTAEAGGKSANSLTLKVASWRIRSRACQR